MFVFLCAYLFSFMFVIHAYVLLVCGCSIVSHVHAWLPVTALRAVLWSVDIPVHHVRCEQIEWNMPTSPAHALCRS